LTIIDIRNSVDVVQVERRQKMGVRIAVPEKEQLEGFVWPFFDR
jgi:hypothetical protein